VLSGALFLSSGSTPQIPRDQLLPTIYQFLERIRPSVFPDWIPSWRILTDVSLITLIALLVVLFTAYVLNRTPFGLRLRAVGENPEAADAAGVSVNKIRYLGVILSGALAGIGGAYLSIGQSSLFTRNMTAGRGFIALAALIFGKWRPVQTMLACLLFGFADALTIQMQGVAKLPSGEDIPVQFIQMIPYVVTIIVLAGFIGQSRAPKAIGIPYEKER
jgi:general nucleoside transport system permease protein